MAEGPLQPVVRRIRRMVGEQDLTQLGDGQLLARFAADRDEAAFAELVQRHGPLVLRVCRRFLADPNAAEDAFQATFLVLVRKAGSIGRGELLAGWLYGVAGRVARRARADAARRREREARAATPAATPDEPTARELGAVLDEELNRLPARYRDAFLLCYVEGKTQDDAARLLGWSLRTLQRRLEQGRDLLRARLTRRGVTLSAALVAVGLAADAAAAPPPLLIVTTIRAGLAFGGGASDAAVSAGAAALARGVLKTMLVNNISRLAVFVLAFAVLAGGATWAAGRAVRDPARRGDGRPDAGPVAVKPSTPEADDAPALPEGAVVRIGSGRWRMPAVNMAWSPDGKRLVVQVRGGPTRVLDTASGRTRLEFAGRKPAGFFPAVSPDGKTVVTWDEKGHTFLWDVTTGKNVRELPTGPPVYRDLEFSPDGKLLAVADCGDVQVWETAGDGERPVFKAAGHFRAVAFSPDGKRLAAGGLGDDRAVRVWDLATGKETVKLPGHVSQVKGLAFSPDGKLLASCSGNDGVRAGPDGDTVREVQVEDPQPGVKTAQPPDKSTVRLWDLQAGKPLWRVTGGHPDISTVAFLADGKTLLTGGGPNVDAWDAATGKHLRTLGGSYPGLGRLSLSPDTKTLALPGDRIILVSTADGTELNADRDAHLEMVLSMQFSADGKTLTSGSADGTVRTWDAATGKALARWEGAEEGVRAVGVGGDGTAAYCGGAFFRTAPVHVRDAAGKEIAAWTKAGRKANFVAVSPDGATVAGLDRGKVKLWKTATAEEVAALKFGSGGEMGPVFFSPDGKLLGAAGDELAVWKVGQDDPVYRIPTGRGIAGAAFCRGGRSLVVVDLVNHARLYDAATGRETATFDVPCERKSGAYVAGVSPDGRLLALSSFWEVDTAVFDLATRQEVCRWSGHEGGTSALTFTPDGTRLAASSRDGTVLVWDLGRLLRQKGKGPESREDAWNDLGADDAATAWRAVCRLAEDEGATKFLGERLGAVRAPDAAKVNALIRRLDADDFIQRDEATAELKGMALLAEGLLRKALQGTPTPEAKRRLEEVLEAAAASRTADGRRLVRAVAALERIGSPAARTELEGLRSRLPQTELDAEAAEALTRLTQRRRD
jgi:RNA polymerase sigma factor (sigma-70 family)